MPSTVELVPRPTTPASLIPKGMEGSVSVDPAYSPGAQAARAAAEMTKASAYSIPGADKSGQAGQGGGIKVKEMGPISQAMAWAQSKLYQAPKPTIASIGTSRSWPSPLQPIPPVGPPGSTPLIWPYNMGQNLNFTPRSDEEFTASDLKALATYPLARICINNIKDYIGRIKPTFQLKTMAGESVKQRDQRGRGNQVLLQVSRFFEYPDGENDWTRWIKLLIEDLLVLDAPSVLVQRTSKGVIAGLAVTRGEAIARYINESGMTPRHPDVAYAQLWNGFPRVQLTTNQLVYRPSNIVPRDTPSSHLYGMSPTEALATEIRIGMLRLRSVLAFYEKGSVPGILHIVPAGVDKGQIAETMNAINARLAGQLEKRRQMQMMQGFRQPNEGEEQILILQDPMLSDAFDEQHIRRVCFGFGTSAQRLTKPMNRASAEAAQDSSEEEGQLTWLDTTADFVNHIIQRIFHFEDIECSLTPKQEVDPAQKAATGQVQVGFAQRTINEIRKEDGLDPDPNPISDKLGFMTPTGFITLDKMEEQQEQAAQQAQELHEANLESTRAGVENTQTNTKLLSANGGSPSDKGTAGKEERAVEERAGVRSGSARPAPRPSVPGGKKEAGSRSTFVKQIGGGPIPQNVLDSVSNDGQRGVMICWRLPDQVASELHIAGGEDTDEMHLTLLYLGKKDTMPVDKIEAIRAGLYEITDQYAPLPGAISGTAIFGASDSTEGREVLVGLADVPRLEALREEIIELCRSVGVEPKLNHGYTPHITRAYLDPGSAPSVPVPNIPIQVDGLCLVYGSVWDNTFRLSGDKMVKALKSFNPNQPRDSDGKWIEDGRPDDNGHDYAGGGSVGRLSRSERASLSHKPSTRAKQVLANFSEDRLSKALNLPRTRDNSPFDLQNDKIGVEVKTVISNENNKITVHPDSLKRKIEAAKVAGIKPVTIVIDHRGYEPVYYYREGVGSYYIHNMDRMTIEEIKGRLDGGSIQNN